MICSESALTSPAFRATFSESGLVLTAWIPWLIQRGGRDGSFRKHAASPAVFDLAIAREKNEGGVWVATELLVTEVVPAEDDVPRRTLLSWAAALDYRCVWWGNEVIVVNLEQGCGLGGVWRSRCSTCGSDWSDDTYSFWIIARGAGFFPLDCTLCGHALPQASLQTDPGTVADARTVTAGDAVEPIPTETAG